MVFLVFVCLHHVHICLLYSILSIYIVGWVGKRGCMGASRYLVYDYDEHLLGSRVFVASSCIALRLWWVVLF